MPANINEQMHNRSLKTSQFTHKINWPGQAPQACASMHGRTSKVHLSKYAPY
jgi:hypothetical protein